MGELTDLMSVESWPQVVVILGGLAYLAFVQHRGRVEVRAVQHEMKNNSGTTMRDAVDRIERVQQEQGAVLDDQAEVLHEHIDESKVWQAQVEDLLTNPREGR